MTTGEIIEAMFAEYEKHDTGTARMVAALNAALPFIVELCAQEAEQSVDPKLCKFQWTGAQKAAEAIRNKRYELR